MQKARRKKVFVIWLVLVFSAWLAGFVWFLTLTPKSTPDINTLHPDALVVFTGGNGRVPAALELAHHYNLKALVSGVNPNVSEEGLLDLYALPEETRPAVTLDYNATSTRENVEQTLRWAQENNLQQVLLVTSFYHMPRSMELFRQVAPHMQVVPYPIHSNQEDIGFLIREYHKYLLVRLGLI